MTNKQDIQTLHAQVVSMSAILGKMLVQLNTMLGEPDDTRTDPPYTPVESAIFDLEVVGGTRVPPLAAAPVTPKPELILNDEWRHVLDVLENGTGHVFVTGEAGTGKSTLLEHFIETTNKVTAVLAPSGTAAIRISGETIHHFFGFGAHAQQHDDIQRLDDLRRGKYRALQVLIIDEASMVRADLMGAIDQFLRVNGRHEGQPFGGCRVIMFGDPYQLPPVVRNDAVEERAYLKARFGTELPYFFHAEVWRETPIQICELTTVFRQTDPAFVAALNAFRNGAILPEHLALLNKRVDAVFIPPDNETWLTLVGTNERAKQINQRALALIKSPSEFFHASVSAGFNLNDAPTDVRLELKVGAPVMFLRNNKNGLWHNGTMGRVLTVEPELTVEVNGQPQRVDPEIWESIEYEHDKKTNKLKRKVKGTFEQIPLKVAAGATVHKGQGQTYDHVIIDLPHTFAAGQGYVAYSRCRTLAGMVLRCPVKAKDFIVNEEVRRFMSGQPVARPAPAIAQVDMFEEGHTNAIPSFTD